MNVPAVRFAAYVAATARSGLRWRLRVVSFKKSSSASSTYLAVRLTTFTPSPIAAVAQEAWLHGLYGEHVKLVSDPFADLECVAVHAVGESNPTIQTIDLAMTLLSGWNELISEPADPIASQLRKERPFQVPN
jgi:hypothetical protein